jgi:AraC-like DNA-binding protein
MKPLFIDTGITDKKLLHIKQVDTPFLDKPFHFHPNCELVLIEEGHGKRVVGDNVSTFHEGDVVLMGPNMPHIWTNDDIFYKGNVKLRSRAVVVYFSPHLLDPLLDQGATKRLHQLLARSERGLALRGRTREVIRAKLAQLHAVEGLAQLVRFLDILDNLCETSETRYLASARFINTYTERDVDRINGVYQFLMQHFKQDIQLAQVAQIAHMAPTAFSRFFKQRTSKPFSRFLNELRIRHACDLLQNSEKTISQISHESGYHNMTNFNKFFREITRLSPSEFRKKLQD